MEESSFRYFNCNLCCRSCSVSLFLKLMNTLKSNSLLPSNRYCTPRGWWDSEQVFTSLLQMLKASETLTKVAVIFNKKDLFYKLIHRRASVLGKTPLLIKYQSS